MAKASDNVFPKVITGMQTSDPAAPSDSSWKLYSKPGGIYARSSNGVVGPFGAGSTFSAAGSNSKDVSGRSYAGDSSTFLAPFDHEHLGVAAITSSSSNTLQRPTVNIRAGTNIGITATDTDGTGTFDTLTIHSTGSGGGGGSSSGFVGARAYNSAGQTSQTSFTTITLDSERFDTDGFHSTVTNTGRMTIPAGKDGKYFIHAQVDISSAASGGNNQARLLVSGAANIANVAAVGNGSANVRLQVSTIYALVAGDYIEFQVATTSSQASGIAASTNYSPEFMIHYLGA